MAFASFLGRVLFASIFILSAYQEYNEFGVDGGPSAKALKPKIDTFAHQIHSQVGFQLPEIDIKLVVAGAIALKGLGGVLFIFGSSFGALLLLLHQLIATPIRYDFYNYESEDNEFTQLFIKFTQNMALFGALLFFIGMKNAIPRRQPKKAPKTKTY
ncbi:HR lesion-inducing protein-like protein [Trifolium repens]|nr:HR lesion-inducing protein-like protein [Trifolium repens]